jgi:enoyl-CoA hydratase/carnithine racemase
MFELTIAGPGKNALGSELMDRIDAQLTRADGQPLLLTGEGDAFSAGLNLKEVASLDADGMGEFLGKLQGLVDRLFDYPGPTVAWVNGHAIAGGCVLALCCDVRIGAANPKAKIGLNELALGLRFPPRLLRILGHQVPAPLLERVVLTAQLYDPAGAVSVGILHHVSDDAEALARARLEALAKIPPAAYAAAKATLRKGLTTVVPEEEQSFRENVIPAWIAPEVKAKLQAALRR